jgi:hypothetical protein
MKEPLFSGADSGERFIIRAQEISEKQVTFEYKNEIPAYNNDKWFRLFPLKTFL